ncbi:MAG: ATP-dependent DNA ligase [archaeon]
MKYSILADMYEELESTTKKLAKTEMIAKLLKTTPSDDLPRVVMLLTGKVFPPWDDREIGVAGQMMIRAIAKSTGVSEKDILDKFKKTGDLGCVSEYFSEKKKQRALFEEQLTVKKVFDNLRKIAEQEGAGSQEHKINLLAELLSSAKPKEALYIARTVLEQLRVGVAEGLIRDAIAQAFELKPEDVENAWNFLPEYGEIAEIAKDRGVKGLQKINLELGTPCNVLLAEKSPDLKTALESYGKVLLQYKYDGMRTLLHKKGDKVWVFTRRLENVTKAFPEIAEFAKKALKAREIIVDSESIGLDPKTGKPIPFQLLSTRIKRIYDIDKAMKDTPVQVNLFDILYLDGKNLFDKPLSERFEILKKEVKEIKGKFVIADSLETKDLKKAEAYYHESLNAGHEGLIVKNLDALYIPGRSVAGGWLKVKPVLENLDVAIVGGVWGTGKRAGWIGSLILGIRDPDTDEFKEIGMMGTGIKEKKNEAGDVTLDEITKMLKPLIISEKENTVKIKPKIIIEVSYEEIQKSPTYESGYALRFPRFIKLRPDKSSEEADDLDRVKKIYEMQKGRRK